jgi:hypothetical protein
MSFKPVRTYLENRLFEVDSDFERIDSAFVSDEAGNLDFNKRFHVFYGNIEATPANQNTTQDIVSATVSLYLRGDRDSSEALDEALDIANQYRINCLRPAYLRQEMHIKNVVCTNIAAQQMDSNDMAIKVILQFRISIIFGLSVNLDC